MKNHWAIDRSSSYEEVSLYLPFDWKPGNPSGRPPEVSALTELTKNLPDNAKASVHYLLITTLSIIVKEHIFPSPPAPCEGRLMTEFEEGCTVETLRGF